MRNAWIVFQRETRSYFVSPVAYVVLIAFLAISGYLFYQGVVNYMTALNSLTERAEMLQQMPPVANINYDVVRPWFNTTSLVLLIISPMITMRLVSEERGTGRLDLLLSAPITDMQLIAGKLMAGIALVVVFLLPTTAYQAILFEFGNPELGPILAGYLGLVLLASALIALGLAISSLTSSQVIAAIGGFAAAIVFWIIGPQTAADTSAWSTILADLSLLRHFVDFSRGVIEMQNIVYFLTFAAFMIFIALRSVESQRWRG